MQYEGKENRMKKVYLFCSAGMSTSMLAAKMQDVANSEGEKRVGDVDCILLGPQVKYLYDETVKNFEKTGIPIAVIDSTDYGMMNGEKVLKSAIKMIRAAEK